MSTIIKSGYTANQKPKVGKCPACDCKFSFENSGVSFDSREGDYRLAMCFRQRILKKKKGGFHEKESYKNAK